MVPVRGPVCLVVGVVALGGCQPAESDSGCRADQLDSAGQCCLGWQVPDGYGCRGRDWPSPSDAVQIGDPGAVRVEVSLDGNDRGLVAWQANAESQLDTEVVVAEQLDAGWTLQYPGRGLAGFGLAPTVATDRRGRAMVTWKQQETETGAVFLGERNVDGAWSWPGPAEPLSFPPTAYEPRPVFAPSGETLVIWNQWAGFGYGVAIARRGSDALEGPLQRPRDGADVLSPAVNFSNAPQPAVSANGDAVITWYQSPNPAPGDATELVVFASERTREGGEFTRPNRTAFISAPGGPVDSHPIRNPLGTVSENGEVVIAWTQENGAGAVPVYMAHRTGLVPGVWTVPGGLEDAFSPVQGRALSAQPVFGTAGELFVVWYQDRGGGPAVWGAHRTRNGEWDVPGDAPDLLSTLGAEAIDPRLAVGTDGQAGVVWQERVSGRWRVMARRRNPGADRWSAAVALSSDAEDATAPTLAIGPTGNAIAAWLVGAALEGRVAVATTATSDM